MSRKDLEKVVFVLFSILLSLRNLVEERTSQLLLTQLNAVAARILTIYPFN